MNDAFALLDEPRRPWLDVASLQGRFLALSAALHPDRVHGAGESQRRAAQEEFAQLNGAYQTLRDTKLRVLHLLELELGHRPEDIQRVPPGTMELGLEVGALCREVDGYLARKGQAATPLLRAQRFAEGLEWTERLGQAQEQVNARRGAIEAELRSLNEVWLAAPAVGAEGRVQALPLDRLEQLYRALSYVARWAEQLDGRKVQLALEPLT
ncbi:MAG: hypothetical protein FJ387_05700 [Verrucomicrobia bacterium]|nr:hypothetical protein [Verrucomicrobiota bacterium]